VVAAHRATATAAMLAVASRSFHRPPAFLAVGRPVERFWQRSRSRPRAGSISERLALDETLRLDLALTGTLTFPEGVDDPADRTSAICRHDRRISR
jgi:hypothetical protein